VGGWVRICSLYACCTWSQESLHTQSLQGAERIDGGLTDGRSELQNARSGSSFQSFHATNSIISGIPGISSKPDTACVVGEFTDESALIGHNGIGTSGAIDELIWLEFRCLRIQKHSLECRASYSHEHILAG